jgi:hypothetical protein
MSSFLWEFAVEVIRIKLYVGTNIMSTLTKLNFWNEFRHSRAVVTNRGQWYIIGTLISETKAILAQSNGMCDIYAKNGNTISSIIFFRLVKSTGIR